MAVIFPSSERKNAVGTSAQKNKPSNFLIRTGENSDQQSNERNGREMGENTGQEPPILNFNFEPSIPVVEAVEGIIYGLHSHVGENPDKGADVVVGDVSNDESLKDADRV
ncbi:hypothetical protein PVK06_009778 [Gossypium arboreum]|uniref:Uncharacterized protein n=1 Tax=Gossypium arboreum TaxID=29729 RepID=A0ABR0QPI0_GOSAR|nr:hypothetical protein PVK06_009778 [Gossypium arboreum]